MNVLMGEVVQDERQPATQHYHRAMESLSLVRLLPLLGQLRLQHNANHSGELFAEDGDVEVTLPLQIHLLDSSNKD